jgi:hypothetical protein
MMPITCVGRSCLSRLGVQGTLKTRLGTRDVSLIVPFRQGKEPHNQDNTRDDPNGSRRCVLSLGAGVVSVQVLRYVCPDRPSWGTLAHKINILASEGKQIPVAAFLARSCSQTVDERWPRSVPFLRLTDRPTTARLFVVAWREQTEEGGTQLIPVRPESPFLPSCGSRRSVPPLFLFPAGVPSENAAHGTCYR